MSLHTERSADAAAPLSLDSAIQEHLQQERASLQSQMELLEKQKNEEIQNLKTSLIAEQQVGVWLFVLILSKLLKHQLQRKQNLISVSNTDEHTVFGVHSGKD